MVHAKAQDSDVQRWTLCLGRHEVCFPIRREALFWDGHGCKQQQYPYNVKRDGPQMCAESDDALKNYIKDPWADVRMKKSLAAPTEK